jgi:hypothetical protein
MYAELEKIDTGSRNGNNKQPKKNINQCAARFCLGGIIIIVALKLQEGR